MRTTSEAAPGAASIPRRATAMVAALALAAGLGAAPAAPADAAARDLEPVAITTGELEWGVRASFRAYVGADGVTTTGLERGPGGTFLWPLVSGTYDPETHETDLAFSGSVNFYGHAGALDLTVSDPRLSITADGAVLYADMTGKEMDGTLIDLRDVDIANLDASEVVPDVGPSTTTWAGLAASLTENGRPAFAGFYSVGAPLDPVTAVYEGPGGKPEMGEVFEHPGDPRYEISETRRLPGLDFPRRTFHDPGRGLLHVVYEHGGYDFVGNPQVQVPEPGYILSFDDDTLEERARRRLPFPVSNAGAWFDPSEGQLYLQTFRSSALAVPAGIYRASYDGATLGDVERLTTLAWGESVIFDPARRTFFTMTGGWHGPVRALEIDGDGEVTVRTLFDTLHGTYPRNPNQWAVDADGDLIIGSSGSGGGDDPRFAAKVIDPSTDPATVTLLPGTRGLEHVALAPDGTLALTGNGVSATFVRDGGAYVPLGDPVEHGQSGHAAAHDGAALFNVLATSSGVLSSIVGDRVVQQFPYRGLNFFAHLSHGDEGQLYGTTADWAEVSPGVYETWSEIIRIDRLGFVPEVVTSPSDVSTTLPAADAVETVVFEVEVAGTPEPDVQWQVRQGAVGRFVDLAGATSPRIEVAADAAHDGLNYRALVSNAAGRVVSEVAALTVYSPPSVLAAPESVVAEPGDDVSFLVMPTGNPYPDIRWQRYADGFWVNVDEADAGLLVVEDVTEAMSGSRFRARLRNSVATVHTDVVTLTVGADEPTVPGPGPVDPGPVDPSPVDPDPAPPRPGPADPFRDLPADSVHRDAVLALYEAGIVTGRTRTTFEPAGTLTRGQVASMVHRAAGLPRAVDDPFVDTAGSPHAPAIAALAEAGIVAGRTTSRFEPNAPVRRDQLASILGRWLELEPSSHDRFVDVTSGPHRGHVNALADAGIGRGRDDGTYGPAQLTRRDQAASLVLRALEHRTG